MSRKSRLEIWFERLLVALALSVASCLSSALIEKEGEGALQPLRPVTPAVEVADAGR